MTNIINGVFSYRQSKQQKQEREEGPKKYRQLDLAEYLNVPRSRISMIENGRILPTPKELELIAEYLEVTPGHLYSRAIIAVIHEIAEGAGQA